METPEENPGVGNALGPTAPKNDDRRTIRVSVQLDPEKIKRLCDADRTIQRQREAIRKNLEIIEEKLGGERVKQANWYAEIGEHLQSINNLRQRIKGLNNRIASSKDKRFKEQRYIERAEFSIKQREKEITEIQAKRAGVEANNKAKKEYAKTVRRHGLDQPVIEPRIEQ